MFSKTAKRVATGLFASVLAVALVAAPASARLKVTTLHFDFNTPGALATDFTTYVATGTLVQGANGGIGDSGSIQPDQVNRTNAVVEPNANYTLGPIGAKYVFSGFMKSEGSSGYSGFGFTALDNNSTNVCDCVADGVFRPNDAFGVSVHGGGWELHNGSVDYSGSWNGSGGTLTDVKTFNNGDLIGNATVSPDLWYKLVFSLTKTSATDFTVRFEVWAANADGTLRSSTADAIFEKTGLQNAGISAATELSSYINFSGYRMTKFDNFATEVTGATIKGAPAGSVSGLDPVTPKSVKSTVSGFWGDSSFVNGAITKGLKKAASTPSTITAVTCTGTTASAKATAADKKLALNRAKNACAFIKTLAPSAKVTTVAKPATGTAGSNRAVIVEITR